MVYMFIVLLVWQCFSVGTETGSDDKIKKNSFLLVFDLKSNYKILENIVYSFGRYGNSWSKWGGKKEIKVKMGNAA